MVFCFFQNFFFGQHKRQNIYFFRRAKRKICFQNLTLGYTTKTLNQIIFFFLHQNQNIFFSNIGNHNIFLEKTITTPFKLNGRSLNFYQTFVRIFFRSLGQLFTDGQRQTRKITTRSSTYCYWVNCIFEQGIFISRNGMEKLSSRRERKKLCLMYSMYHGHAPSYLCDLLPPLVRDVTNYSVRKRNDYTVQRCCLSLYQSSFIPSVINLLNSLDNDTKNNRTFDTFKLTLNVKLYWLISRIISQLVIEDPIFYMQDYVVIVARNT